VKASKESPLTKPLMDKILATAASCRLFDSQIAIRSKVDPGTLKLWLKKGLVPDAVEPYRTFAKEYSRIQIEHEGAAAEEVYQAGMQRDPDEPPRGDWKASAWFLERRWPKRWNPARQPLNGPSEGIDIEQLIRDMTQREESLKELFANPPPELEEAMRENADVIRALIAALPEKTTG
jgi:hypothetical protein